MNFRTTVGRGMVFLGLTAGLLVGGMALVGMQTEPADVPYRFDAAG